MVVEEPFVTRRPFLFVVLVLVILVCLYIPANFIIKQRSSQHYSAQLNETYSEVWHWFNIGSPLTSEEKDELFDVKYKGSSVIWTGELLECRSLGKLFSVRISHRGTEFSDVVFSTKEDCTSLPKGSKVTYKIELVDLRVNVFVGKNGKFISSPA